MKLTPMQARCHQPECGALFEAKAPNRHEFRRLYRSLGWRQRGTHTGWHVFCPRHLG